jgi:NADP-dependent aldehyde dehydrogenase
VSNARHRRGNDRNVTIASGTDTVSALAAGCPVVVKAHPAHPGTSDLVGRSIVAAAARTAMPPGIFTLIQGAGHAVGLALLRHPLLKAVAFTGSLRGGRALFDAAAARPEPIPVYAEMGSMNPVILLPHALAERGAAIARAYVQSVTSGVGQFCTKTGLVFGIEGSAWDGFLAAAGSAARAFPPATMLHAGILRAFETVAANIASIPGVRVVGRSEGTPDARRTQAACVLFSTGAGDFEAHPHLGEEVFGPVSLAVSCPGRADLERIIRGLGGHLTASVHGTDADLAEHRELIDLLLSKVGRIVWNGFGTGIEVSPAFHHGGPYPATTCSQFTSIWHASIFRFARPLCYQNFPDAALPEALRNRNTLGIQRLADGRITRDDL